MDLTAAEGNLPTKVSRTCWISRPVRVATVRGEVADLRKWGICPRSSRSAFERGFEDVGDGSAVTAEAR